MSRTNPLRALPQVEAVLSSPVMQELLGSYRRELLLRLLRAELDQLRSALAAGTDLPADALTAEAVAAATLARLRAVEACQLRPVINASGVLLHTNLGRSVLGARAREALQTAAGGYCNIELDLTSGKRSHRDDCVEPLLCALTGAEAATVVNNCAAAVHLVLYTLARRREVVTSRGELVEIGGNFRVPDVVRASGCRLMEVGTTNRTRLSDYAAALTERTALLLKTHQSNYRIRGFTEETSVSALALLARQHGIPLVVDAGSGLLETAASDTEIAVPEAIKAGAQLVCFSGDKLLGGPQAGIICGEPELVGRLRGSPLWRALRVDKLTLSALGATLAEALRQPGRGLGGGMPLLAERLGAQQANAEALARLLAATAPGWSFECLELPGSHGGGSLPDEDFPGWAVALAAPRLSGKTLHSLLRGGTPAVLGVMQRGRCCLHVAALLPGDAEQIAQRIRGLAG